MPTRKQILTNTGDFTGLFQPALHHHHNFLTILQQRPGGRKGNQVTSLMGKKRTADVLFSRVHDAR